MGRAVFFGQKGELRKKYREGQEDQLGALGLVVNMIVLWNTQYMDRALNHLRASGFVVRDEDAAGCPPSFTTTFACWVRTASHCQSR